MSKIWKQIPGTILLLLAVAVLWTAAVRPTVAQASFVLGTSENVEASSDWEMAGDTQFMDGSYVLTESESQQVGGLYYKIPLDTRNGFSVSFQYQISQRRDDPREGMALIFATEKLSPGYYGTNFGYWDYVGGDASCHQVAFQTRSGAIAAQKSEGDNIIQLCSEKKGYTQNKWYEVLVVYENDILIVYEDGQQVLLCDTFDLPDNVYMGFSASTYLYAFGMQKQEVRNPIVQVKNSARLYLDGNGGNVKEDSIYILGGQNNAIPEPTRKGYDFAGWYTEAKGGERVDGTGYALFDGMTIYAHWKEGSYRVIFKANGGKVATKDKYVTYGDKYGTLPTPTRTGYTFDGWYTKENGGDKVTATKKYTRGKKQKLYAHWDANEYTVTFNANGGSVSEKTRKVQYDKKLGGLPSPTRSGYSFDGWYTKATGGTKISSATLMKGDVTCYAQWTKSSSGSSGSSSTGSSSSSSTGGSSSGSSSSSRQPSTPEIKCYKCHGDGDVTCSNCNGRGYKIKYVSSPNYSGHSSTSRESKETCYKCHGSGEITCSTCGGDGKR